MGYNFSRPRSPEGIAALELLSSIPMDNETFAAVNRPEREAGHSPLSPRIFAVEYLKARASKK
jgi:hypothetical protein